MLELKIIEVLKRKTNDELKKFQFIGAEIKSSRLKLSKTLDSICNVNKSISYISKIENNKIIPNKNSLMELCDELFITKEDLENMKNFDNCLLEAIECIYKIDYDSMVKLHNKYANFVNVRTDLMKGLYYLLFKDYDNLNTVIENLKRVEQSLSLDDYLIYILLEVGMLIYKKELISAYKITKAVIESESTKNTLKNLFEVYLFQIKLLFCMSTLDYEYNQLLNIHAMHLNMKQIKNLVYNHCELIIELSNGNTSSEFIEKIDFNDLKCYAYAAKNDLINATRYFDESMHEKYKMYYYFKTEKLDELINLLKTPMDEELLIIGNCYKFELEKNEESYKTYLINIVIPYFKSKARIKYLLHYYNKVTAICFKTAKYKETGILGQEITKLMIEVTNLLSMR